MGGRRFPRRGRGLANRCSGLAEGAGGARGGRASAARKQPAPAPPALHGVEAANNRNDIFIARFMSWAITYQSLSWFSRMHLVFQTCSFCASGSWTAAA